MALAQILGGVCQRSGLYSSGREAAELLVLPHRSPASLAHSRKAKLVLPSSQRSGITPRQAEQEGGVLATWLRPQHPMSTHRLNAALFGAAVSLAAVLTQPAQAQMYGNGNGWQQQPRQSGPLVRPSQSGGPYQPNRPVMQQPNFDSQIRMPSQGGNGYRSGSNFGW